MPGAGQSLLDAIATEARVRYAPESSPVNEREMRVNLLKEFFEAINALEKTDLADQSRIELIKTESELAEIETALGYARAHVRTALAKKRSIHAVR